MNGDPEPIAGFRHIRTLHMSDEHTIRLNRFELRPHQRLLSLGGRPCRLGGRAFDVLLLLVKNHHRVVSNAELFEHVWPGMAVESNNLQVQICSLRKLLGQSAIVTVPRRGYRYVGVEPDSMARPVHAVEARAAVTGFSHVVAQKRDGDSQRRLLRWRPRER